MNHFTINFRFRETLSVRVEDKVDEMSEDDLFNLDDKVGQDGEMVVSPPALSQMPSKITEVSGDLLDDTFDDR